jgi:hypothetical protein
MSDKTEGQGLEDILTAAREDFRQEWTSLQIVGRGHSPPEVHKIDALAQAVDLLDRVLAILAERPYTPAASLDDTGNSQQDWGARNMQISQAELDGDGTSLGGILHDNLAFRRAGGSIVVKEDYLEGLKSTKYEQNVQEDVKVALFEPAAVISLNIRAKGIRNHGKPDEASFEGLYHNTRLFVKGQEDWQLAVWYNTPVNQP